MTGLIILGNGFEIAEAIVPLDYLFRAGINVIKASVSEKVVTSQEGIKVYADTLLENVDFNEFDFLIIPGGKASFTVLDKVKKVDDAIDYYANNNKLVAAICAAPFLVGRRGYFNNINYTCFPSFEEYVKLGTYKKECGVVVEKGFITAKSVYYASSFAYEIIKYLKGEEAANKVLLQVKAEQ